MKLGAMRFHVPKTWHELQHKGGHFCHMTYLGFTWIEGHGLHAHAAGLLFVMVFAGLFVHESGAA